MKYLIMAALVLLSTPIGARRVVFMPQWSAQAQFAGYYAAQSKDYYKSEGLNVEIIHPSQSENAYSLLKSGKAQLVSLNLSQALHYFSQGADLVSVQKGWNYTATHEVEDLKITMNQIKENQIMTNEYHQQQRLKEILRLQKSPETGERSYRLSENFFQTALNFISPGMLKYDDFVK